MPPLAPLNTTRKPEPARTRSSGADSMMQQTADRQVGTSNILQYFALHLAVILV